MLSPMGSVTVVAKGSLLEGRVVSDGEVIVEAGAEVRAEIRARRVVIRGIVRGDVIATEVRLEEGGRLIGGLRTPAAEAAVAVANAAATPKASRTPVTAQMADELAEAIALDATREITSSMSLENSVPPGGAAPGTEPRIEGAPASSTPADPARRVVAVRRKGPT